MDETKPEIGDETSGYCQSCLQDVTGRIMATRPYMAGARTLRLLDRTGREHRVIETVSQRLLTTQELAALTRKYKRQREEARKDIRSETTEPTQTEHHEITDAESGFEVASTGEETSSELDK